MQTSLGKVASWWAVKIVWSRGRLGRGKGCNWLAAVKIVHHRPVLRPAACLASRLADRTPNSPSAPHTTMSSTSPTIKIILFKLPSTSPTHLYFGHRLHWSWCPLCTGVEKACTSHPHWSPQMLGSCSGQIHFATLCAETFWRYFLQKIWPFQGNLPFYVASFKFKTFPHENLHCHCKVETLTFKWLSNKIDPLPDLVGAVNGGGGGRSLVVVWPLFDPHPQSVVTQPRVNNH